MTRTKLSDRILPNYTKGEEIFNMTSHIVGGSLGIVALVLCVTFAAINNNIYGIISGSIYGITLILLYTMSSIYHGLNPKKASKKVLQVLDHCSIFLLIAGTYTPFTLVGIRSVDISTGWWIFAVIWGTAILGIILNAIDLKKYSKFSMICYLGMGWCIVVKANLLPKFLTTTGIWLLILGGLAYTVGAVLYGLGSKNNYKYAHSVFHLFTVIGSLLHFICIILYLI